MKDKSILSLPMDWPSCWPPKIKGPLFVPCPSNFPPMDWDPWNFPPKDGDPTDWDY